MIDDFGGIGLVRRKLGLDAELHSARSAGVAFEAQIFVEHPEDVGGIFVLFEQ